MSRRDRVIHAAGAVAVLFIAALVLASCGPWWTEVTVAPQCPTPPGTLMQPFPGPFPPLPDRAMPEAEVASAFALRDERIDVLHKAVTELQAWAREPLLRGETE